MSDDVDPQQPSHLRPLSRPQKPTGLTPMKPKRGKAVQRLEPKAE